MKKAMLLGLALMLAGAGYLHIRPYQPLLSAKECLLVQLPNESGEPIPSALFISKVEMGKHSLDKAERDAQYEGLLVIGMIMPRPVMGSAQAIDKELSAMKFERVNCETGEPLK